MIAKPLHDLVGILNKEGTKKKIIIGQLWSRECDGAFNKFKETLISTSILGFTDFSLPFILKVDNSLLSCCGETSILL